MGDVSAFFNRYEFACKCGCGFNSVDFELLHVLEDVRQHFDRPTTINSGCRCPEYNEKIGGKKGSKHRHGIAADIVVKNVQPCDVFAYLNRNYPDKYGMGNYETFTHIDVREVKTRW